MGWLDYVVRVTIATITVESACSCFKEEGGGEIHVELN